MARAFLNQTGLHGMETIDDAVVSMDRKERFHAANKMILKIWNYMEELIEEQNKKNEEPVQETNEETTQEEQNELIKKIFDSLAAPEEECEEECCTPPEGWSGNLESEEAGDETPQTAMAEPDKTEENSEEDVSESPLSNLLSQFRKSLKSQEERPEWESICEPSVGEGYVTEDGDYEGNGYLDAAEDMNRILFDIAEEKYEKEEEKKLVSRLQQQVTQIDFGKVHSDCNFQIHRIGTVSSSLKDMYNDTSPEILKLSRRLKEEMRELLFPAMERMEKNLHLGKRLNQSGLYRQDKRIFMSRKQDDDSRQLAIAVLIDESYSMNEAERITYGRLTALLLYDFCDSTGIPVLIYGHSTSYESTYDHETVDLYAYAEFDSVDGNDRYRIMDISPRGSNRDGAALRFVSERLKERPEDTKLLFLVSDGQPAGYNYSGELAKKDLQELKNELKRKGILLFAAAIGDDREVMEEIYEDGYLDISNLASLPVRLVRKMMRYIR